MENEYFDGNMQSGVDEQRLSSAQNKANQKNRNVANNTRVISQIADVASNTNNPYAKAIGSAVKTADKMSGGKASGNSPGRRLMQKTANKLTEDGTADRISKVINKRKPGLLSAISLLKPKNNKSEVPNDNLSNREMNEKTEYDGGISFKVSVKVLKIAMVAFVPVFVIVVFMNLFVAASQTYLHVIGLGQADEVSSEEADEAIRENGAEGLDEEITDKNVYDGSANLGYVYPTDIFIDDSNYTNKKLTNLNFIANERNREYNEADLKDLEDFYSDIGSYKDQGYDMNTVYKFFFKLLFIQRHYSDYNVDLDMPLIMSVLSVQSEDKSEIFISNVEDYKIYYGCIKEDDSSSSDKCQPKDNPIFKPDYDWSNYTLSKNSSAHDIEILAQKMVKKTNDNGCIVNGVDGPCYELVDDDEYREFLKEFLEKKYYIYQENTTSPGNVGGSGSISFDEIYSNGDSKIEPGIDLSSEPDPSTAINYWSYVDTKDFVYPKDKSTGKSLGAWPKNYQNIPAQLENMKVYQGSYIWPLTPTSSIYTFVYEHNGMDIMASFGAPIYSPVDGDLIYSTWGNTVNTGSDETAYSVTISPDVKVTYGGTTIDMIFFTHMSGIIYRCEWGQCNRKVKKGELIGFVGNAAGNATSVGWAPHLHLTYYNSSDYSTGLQTSVIEKFYGIKPNTKIVAGG